MMCTKYSKLEYLFIVFAVHISENKNNSSIPGLKYVTKQIMDNILI